MSRKSRKLRIIVLSDLAETPPADQNFQHDLHLESWACERHVLEGLRALGHEVRLICLYDSIAPLLTAVHEFTPDFIFNIAEQFANQPFMERNIAGLIEMLGIPYSGSGPSGLVLCKNKAIAKKILSYHRIRVPKFASIPPGKTVGALRELSYPLFVKALHTEASVGIAKASHVESREQLEERVHFIHTQHQQAALIEEFIAGRELYVSMLGNERIEVLPIRELDFGNLPDSEPQFATHSMKWDKEYRKRWSIRNTFARSINPTLEQRIHSVCKRAYRHLRLRGFARIDLRVTNDEKIYVLEANPNPFIAREEDYAMSAKKAGYSYEALLDRIVRLGLNAKRR